MVRLWSSASLLAWPGVTVAFVVPAKAAAVVAEVTMTSRWRVSFAVKKVISDLWSLLSSSGCSLLIGFVAMSCSVRGRCPVIWWIRPTRSSRMLL